MIINTHLLALVCLFPPLLKKHQVFLLFFFIKIRK